MRAHWNINFHTHIELYFQAICVYWMSTNFVSLCQVTFLKVPAVRKYFEIPEKNVHVKTEMKKTRKGIVKDFKSCKYFYFRFENSIRLLPRWFSNVVTYYIFVNFEFLFLVCNIAVSEIWICNLRWAIGNSVGIHFEWKFSTLICTSKTLEKYSKNHLSSSKLPKHIMRWY